MKKVDKIEKERLKNVLLYKIDVLKRECEWLDYYISEFDDLDNIIDTFGSFARFVGNLYSVVDEIKELNNEDED